MLRQQAPPPTPSTTTTVPSISVVTEQQPTAPTQSNDANQQSIADSVQIRPNTDATVEAFDRQPTTSPTTNMTSQAAAADDESTLIVGDLSCLRDKKFRAAPAVPNADIKYLRLVTYWASSIRHGGICFWDRCKNRRHMVCKYYTFTHEIGIIVAQKRYFGTVTDRANPYINY